MICIRLFFKHKNNNEVKTKKQVKKKMMKWRYNFVDVSKTCSNGMNTDKQTNKQNITLKKHKPLKVKYKKKIAKKNRKNMNVNCNWIIKTFSGS